MGGKCQNTVRSVGGNLKSWVVNYTWYNIQTDIILEIRNLEIQIR